MALSLTMLGAFAVRDGAGTALSLPTRKTRALLGYLAYHAGQPQSREKLAALLWGDRGDKQARHSLNQSLGAIRKLGLDTGPNLLQTDTESVRLVSDALEIDVARLRSLLDTDPLAAAGLYRGPLLDGVSIADPGFEEWLAAARTELHGMVCSALEQAAVAAAHHGRMEEAMTAARRLVALDPLCEEGHRLLMRLLFDAGSRTGAIRQYHLCADLLKRELQVEPDTATRSLYKTIRWDTNSHKQSVSEAAVGEAHSSGADASPSAMPSTLQRKPARSKWWIFAVVAAAFALVIGAGLVTPPWPWLRKTEPVNREGGALPLPDRPSIAVLPFQNLSNDPGQAYFGDGMTDDLITDLSKISGLFVIARNSVFAYKSKPVTAKRIARELGVRYVLEGSVRRVGNHLRINAQLIDTMTGGPLWAERYDGALTDIFAFQDRVTKKIVAALAINLTKDEEIRRSNKYTDNAEAYDAFLKGWIDYRRFSANDFVKAVPFFEKAVELDPNYGQAYAALASLYWESMRQGYSWTSKVIADSADCFAYTASRVKAASYLTLAMRNPSPLAYRVASAMSWELRQFDEAAAQARQAVVLDPNDPDGYVALAWAEIFTGRPDEALKSVKRAMRLDPKNADAYFYVLGLARLGLSQYKEALTTLQHAQARNPDDLDVNVPVAVVYTHLGRKEDARAALKRYAGVWRPYGSTVDEVLGWWPFKQEADVRRFGRGLVEAGLCCNDRLDQYIENLRRGGTLE